SGVGHVLQQLLFGVYEAEVLHRASPFTRGIRARNFGTRTNVAAQTSRPMASACRKSEWFTMFAIVAPPRYPVVSSVPSTAVLGKTNSATHSTSTIPIGTIAASGTPIMRKPSTAAGWRISFIAALGRNATSGRNVRIRPVQITCLEVISSSLDVE